MEALYKIDHKLDLDNKIKKHDKYFQFSKENTERKKEVEKKWFDCLETILFQLDSTYNLMCLSPNSKSECIKYLLSARSELMDNLVSKELVKKYKYNTRTGMSKVNITKSFEVNINTHVGLIFYSDYFEINIVLVDRENKKYFDIKEPIPEQHYLMINLDEKEFIPPLSIGSYLLKKDELISHLNNYTIVNKLVEITDTIDSNIKNINNIYKRDNCENVKKITDFKIVDLQNIAKVNNIPIVNTSGKKKTKAQLFEELKEKL